MGRGACEDGGGDARGSGEEGILASEHERAYVNDGKLRSAESCTSTMVTTVVDEVVGDIAMGEDGGELDAHQLADPW